MCLIKWNLPKVDTSIGYDTGHPGLNLATSNHTDESYDEQAVCEKKMFVLIPVNISFFCAGLEFCDMFETF